MICVVLLFYAERKNFSWNSQLISDFNRQFGGYVRRSETKPMPGKGYIYTYSFASCCYDCTIYSFNAGARKGLSIKF